VPSPELTRLLPFLADPTAPLSAKALTILSSLGPEDLRVVREAWSALPPDRRQQVFRLLVEMEEDNVEYDFSDIFWLGLDDADAAVRVLALNGLWGEMNVRLVRPLMRLMTQDPATLVRAAAAEVLGPFASRAAEGKLPVELSRELRAALLVVAQSEREPVEVQQRALESLAYWDDEEVVGLITQAYQAGDDALKASALFAMGRTCDERWARTLLETLTSAEPRFRYEAARACGEMELAPAVHRLIVLAREDDDLEVREAAIWALGQIGGPAARATLAHLSRQSDDEEIREAAEEALDMIEFAQRPLSSGAGKWKPLHLTRRTGHAIDRGEVL